MDKNKENFLKNFFNSTFVDFFLMKILFYERIENFLKLQKFFDRIFWRAVEISTPFRDFSHRISSKLAQDFVVTPTIRL